MSRTLAVPSQGYGREHIVFLVDAAENMFTDKLEIEVSGGVRQKCYCLASQLVVSLPCTAAQSARRQASNGRRVQCARTAQNSAHLCSSRALDALTPPMAQ